MFSLTALEKKVIIFLCVLLLCGGLLKVLNINIRTTESRQNYQFLKLNINEASLEELKRLPSIGEKIAKEIIIYRQTYGVFRSLEDLKRVKGIGDKKIEIIKEFITF